MSQAGGPRRKWVTLIVCALLIPGLVGLVVTRPHSRHAGLVKMDSKGATTLGPFPLLTTNVRDAAFSLISYLNRGTASVTAVGSLRTSNLVETVNAMQRAGITSITLRVEKPPGNESRATK